MPQVTLHPPGAAPDAAPSTPTQAPAAPPAGSPPASPSQQVVQAANKTIYVTDALGRRIGWRKLNALEDFDLTEIAGQNETNFGWMVRATAAFGVREIDGEPVPRPTNKTQLRAMVARLDDAGMDAILNIFREEAEAKAQAEIDSNGDSDAETTRAKN